MQLRYVFSETGTGLRRNVSMSIALVVTIFVSLTLVGMGLLVNAQAHKAEEYWGSKLQITVFLCNRELARPAVHLRRGHHAAESRRSARAWRPTPRSRPTSPRPSKAYAFWKESTSRNDRPSRIYSTIKPKDMQESFRVTLKDPQKFKGVETPWSGWAASTASATCARCSDRSTSG